MSALVLKLIAYVTMTYDHFGFFLGEKVFRGIGRVSLPIFCFLIAQGFRNARSVPKYACRLLALALLSEIPYNYFVSGSLIHIAGQNVVWTLLLGLLCIWVMQLLREHVPRYSAPLSVLTVLVCCMAANLLITDYNYFGVLLIVIFDRFPLETQRDKLFATLSFTGLIAWRFVSCGLYRVLLTHGIDPMKVTAIGRFFLTEIGEWEMIKILAIAALPILCFYNGKKGSLGDARMDKWLSVLFYLYYPCHLLLIALIYR